jgi:hypothetical protein
MTEHTFNYKELTINGVVSVPDAIDADKFSDEFIEWIESKGYSFGGGIGPYKDEDEANPENPFPPIPGYNA